MEIKTVNRNIPKTRENKNDRFRVKYNDRKSFKSLVVNVTRLHTGEKQSYTFKAEKLPDKDSIYFSTAVINNKLVVHWFGANPTSKQQSEEPMQSLSKTKNKARVKISYVTQKQGGIITAKSGFAPIVFPDSTVLILGTMPGEQSLTKQEYYAHPRNLTWKIIATLLKEQIPKDYPAKKLMLKEARIALWDVCDVCERDGSLDTAIMDEIPNDLKKFLKKYKEIKIIAFNGGKAEKLYDKHFSRDPVYSYLSLPSSSPANAGINWETKVKMWEKLLVNPTK